MRLEPASAPQAGPDRHATPEARRRREQVQWQGRQRLERQLHDGAALRVSALVLQLGLFRHRVPPAETDLREAIDSVQDELHAVLQELRAVAAQIYPPLLDEAGLGPALRELADQLDVRLRVTEQATAEQATNGSTAAPRPEGPGEQAAADRPRGTRFGAAAEGAVYFAVVDWLSASPPAGPVDVVITREDGDLVVVVQGPLELLGILAELFADRARPLGGVVTCGPEPDPLPAAARQACAPGPDASTGSTDPAGPTSAGAISSIAVSNGTAQPTVTAEPIDRGPIDAAPPHPGQTGTEQLDPRQIGTAPMGPAAPVDAAVPTGTIVARIPCE